MRLHRDWNGKPLFCWLDRSTVPDKLEHGNGDQKGSFHAACERERAVRRTGFKTCVRFVGVKQTTQ